MQLAVCAGCGKHFSAHGLTEFRPGFAACACGAVLGRAADIVVRESDGKAVFDPGASIETPSRFVTTHGEAPTKGGYRVNAAPNDRMSLSISFPIQAGADLRFVTTMAAVLFALVMIFPFLVNEWAVTPLAVVVAVFASVPTLYFLHRALAYALNRTTSTCADGYVRVRSTPVPLGSVQVHVDDIDSVYCQRLVNLEGRTVFFAVAIRRASGGTLSLVTRFEEIEEALWVARAVRTGLRLEPGRRSQPARSLR